MPTASRMLSVPSKPGTSPAANALPSLNHPNFRWAFTSKEILQIRDLNLFEVYNGHPEVNNLGYKLGATCFGMSKTHGSASLRIRTS